MSHILILVRIRTCFNAEILLLHNFLCDVFIALVDAGNHFFRDQLILLQKLVLSERVYAKRIFIIAVCYFHFLFFIQIFRWLILRDFFIAFRNAVLEFFLRRKSIAHWEQDEQLQYQEQLDIDSHRRSPSFTISAMKRNPINFIFYIFFFLSFCFERARLQAMHTNSQTHVRTRAHKSKQFPHNISPEI